MTFYRRQVHDSICLFNYKSNGNKFNKQISFLDVLVRNDGDLFCTSVFRKEIAIGLFTNYLGFTPFSHKVGLVRTLLHCAFMISSSWFLFQEEFVKIKYYLEKISYPLSFVDEQVKFFLENKIDEKSGTGNATNNDIKYYKLRSIGHISTYIKRKTVNFIVKV